MKRKATKGRKADSEEKVIEVDSYSLSYQGPYPSDAVRVNTVRYTPTQGALFHGLSDV